MKKVIPGLLAMVLIPVAGFAAFQAGPWPGRTRVLESPSRVNLRWAC